MYSDTFYVFGYTVSFWIHLMYYYNTFYVFGYIWTILAWILNQFVSFLSYLVIISFKRIMHCRMEAEILEATTQELMMHDYPSDCCPEGCYLKFPCIAGDPDSPFWQGWGNLRIKTFRLIENKYFETAVITMILISSLALVRTESSYIHLSLSHSHAQLSFAFIGNDPPIRTISLWYYWLLDTSILK